MLTAALLCLLTAEPVDWRAERSGAHFALGAGGMVLPSQARAPAELIALMPSVGYAFRWVELRATLQLLGYFTSYKAGFAAFDVQVRLNGTRFFTVGAGGYFGIAATPELDLATGVSVSPAIVKLGERGQHELSIWVALPFVASDPRLVLALLSYTRVF